jgi:hypothetical protein
MSDVFVSYARSTATQAQQIAWTLRGLGLEAAFGDVAAYSHEQALRSLRSA